MVEIRECQNCRGWQISGIRASGGDGGGSGDGDGVMVRVSAMPVVLLEYGVTPDKVIPHLRAQGSMKSYQIYLDKQL